MKSNKNNQNLVENVKLMLEMAKAKGWDLNNLHIRGTEQFINEVKRQVAKENEKESLNFDNKDAAKDLRELFKSESKKQNKDYDL
ncbi:LPD7 domain-containing protein [Poseidonibacter sp.]|uniref:LPD7 domain-containing protein n=1 Tax=Poseidonibacter sp. TaxID=2321188 RepID=UPI003C752159